jgi:RNA polymerase sigma-70 factor (ECF subfamily)
MAPTTFPVEKIQPREGAPPGRDELYRQCVEEFGAALDRLAYAYEIDQDLRRDLLQEIHLELWRSFENFHARCSLRTWTYRVAHNVATSHVTRQIKKKRNAPALLTLEEAEAQASQENIEALVDHHKALTRLLSLVQRLDLVDRQLILGYLEGLDAESIGEIVGLSTANVWTRVHRIRNLLVRQFHRGGPDAR